MDSSDFSNRRAFFIADRYRGMTCLAEIGNVELV